MLWIAGAVLMYFYPYLGGLVIVVLAIFTIIRLNQKKVNAFNHLDWASSWAKARGVDESSILFGFYDKPSQVKNKGASVIVGVGRDCESKEVGFVIEVRPKDGVVEELFLSQSGLISHHKKWALMSAERGIPIIDIARAIDLERNKEKAVYPLCEDRALVGNVGNNIRNALNLSGEMEEVMEAGLLGDGYDLIPRVASAIEYNVDKSGLSWLDDMNTVLSLDGKTISISQSIRGGGLSVVLANLEETKEFCKQMRMLREVKGAALSKNKEENTESVDFLSRILVDEYAKAVYAQLRRQRDQQFSVERPPFVEAVPKGSDSRSFPPGVVQKDSGEIQSINLRALKSTNSVSCGDDLLAKIRSGIEYYIKNNGYKWLASERAAICLSGSMQVTVIEEDLQGSGQFHVLVSDLPATVEFLKRIADLRKQKIEGVQSEDEALRQAHIALTQYSIKLFNIFNQKISQGRQ